RSGGRDRLRGRRARGRKGGRDDDRDAPPPRASIVPPPPDRAPACNVRTLHLRGAGCTAAAMSSSQRTAAGLEDVIGEVAASYGAGRLIDSLSTAQLPNKRQVIEALNHLKATMYLGHYSTGSLDDTKLRFAVASHLYPAAEILTEQIRRAASYEGFRNAGVPREPEWPERVVLALLRKVPAIRALLSKDVLAAFQGDPAANSVQDVIFSYPSIAAITTHRIAHELYRERVPMLPRIMAEHTHANTGIDIHPGAEIGESFFIDHGTGVVIGETCVIGNSVKIYQGVTL